MPKSPTRAAGLTLRPVPGPIARQLLCRCSCHDSGARATSSGRHPHDACECTNTPDSVWQERHLAQQQERRKQQHKFDKVLARTA